MSGFSPVRAAECLLLILLLLTAGCAASAPDEIVAPEVTATTVPGQAPEATVALLPTVTLDVSQAASAAPTAAPQDAPAAAATETPTEIPDWTRFAAQEGDYYVLGNPDAPIRLIDYSDFL